MIASPTAAPARTRIDRRALAIGGTVAAVAAYAGAWLSSALTDTTELGPTGAALTEAFSLLFGASVGIGSGAAVGAALARDGRFLSGLAAAAVGYVALFPGIALTGEDDDLTAGVTVAVLVLPYVTVFAAAGALLGLLVVRLSRPLVRARRH